MVSLVIGSRLLAYHSTWSTLCPEIPKLALGLAIVSGLGDLAGLKEIIDASKIS